MASRPADLKHMTLDQVRKIVKKEEKFLKKELTDLAEKNKLIERYKKIIKARQKVGSKIIKKKPKPKSFQEYFDECIKNRKIPEDTPPHFRKALEKVLKQYRSKITKTKSALNKSVNQYQIEGDSNLMPDEFFKKNKKKIEQFLKKNKNTKVNFVLVGNMQQPLYGQNGFVGYREDEAHFRTKTKKVLESTNLEKLVKDNIDKINLDIDKYQQNGSGWSFMSMKKA